MTPIACGKHSMRAKILKNVLKSHTNARKTKGLDWRERAEKTDTK